MSRFILPKERWPKAFNQNRTSPRTDVDSCVACTFTKILEVINCVNTGVYTELSKGYMYVRNNYPGNKNGGMQERYTLGVLLERGTVPAAMCTDYGEYPEIKKTIEERGDIAELDRIAENFKLTGWTDLTGNNSKERFDNIKKYLKEKLVPLAVTIKNYRGRKHSVVAIGYEDEKILRFDHDGTEKIHSLTYDKFSMAFYLDGLKNEDKEDNNMAYKIMDLNEFQTYVNRLKVTRKITLVQLHHTAEPSYDNFTGNNHLKLQDNMKRYHVNSCGYSDIAQTFTIFPDGKICTGRDINVAPAGIYGANANGICIECVGNFSGVDNMTDAQSNAIVGAVRILLDKFGINAKTGVTYHSWWTSGGSNLGTYISGRSCKPCPGTTFFGGNTREAYEKNLLPLIENYGEEEKVLLETANDITWELNHTYFPIDDMKRFVEVLDEAKTANSPIYWGYYKLVNRIK
jgi:hypothetical protein